MQYFDYLEEIKKIILDYFNFELINNSEYRASIKLKKKVLEFTNGKKTWENKTELFDLLRNKYPAFTFDNQANFVYSERCLRFNATKRSEDLIIMYTIYLSVFNLFCVTIGDFEGSREKSVYVTNTKFIDRGQDTIADELFLIIRKYYPHVKWVPGNILLKSINELKVFPGKLKNDYRIIDVLFTEVR